MAEPLKRDTRNKETVFPLQLCWQKTQKRLSRTTYYNSYLFLLAVSFSPFKGSWEAIFRVTDQINSMKGGVLLYITLQWEVWDYIHRRVVWELTSHHNEKRETILNEWWCESLHHITMTSVRLYWMNGRVRVDITSRWEAWGYIQWMVVWELTSHHDEKCETILNECRVTVRVDITSRWEVWGYIQWMVVWELTSHHDEKCETIHHEWWCVSLHSGCRLQCNGCMIVVVLCCHVRWEMRV